jgi:ATP-dependent Clp protease ATP-binding subunit ClpA
MTDAARAYLSQKGFDPAYGARPLKRLIQREIENELALKLLDGTFRDGDEVSIDAGAGSLAFEKASGAAEA